MLMISRDAAELEVSELVLLELPVVVAAAPLPKPVYTAPSEAVEAAAPAVVLVDDMVEMVLVLTRVGF